MPQQLYVGNLAFKATEAELAKVFEAYGDCTVKIIRDRETQRSRGFGFVEYQDAECAQAAIERLDGAEVCGRTITVRRAEPRQERGNRPRDWRD